MGLDSSTCDSNAWARPKKVGSSTSGMFAVACDIVHNKCGQRMISRVSLPPLVGRSPAVSSGDRGNLEEAYTRMRTAAAGLSLTRSSVIDSGTDRMDSIGLTILQTSQSPWQSVRQPVGAHQTRSHIGRNHTHVAILTETWSGRISNQVDKYGVKNAPCPRPLLYSAHAMRIAAWRASMEGC